MISNFRTHTRTHHGADPDSAEVARRVCLTQPLLLAYVINSDDQHDVQTVRLRCNVGFARWRDDVTRHAPASAAGCSAAWCAPWGALRCLLFSRVRRHHSRSSCSLNWLRGTAVERRSLASELPLSCARPVADGWPFMWVNRPLQVNQPRQLSFSSFTEGSIMSSKLQLDVCYLS